MARSCLRAGGSQIRFVLTGIEGNKKLKTLHGSYTQVGSEWYLLSWTSLRAKDQIEEIEPRIHLLQRASGCLVEVIGAISGEINHEYSLFQRIVFLNYTDIAGSFSNAISLLQTGSLADSLTLVRPVLEYLLDIAYLSLYPDEVELYESKADAPQSSSS